MHIDYVCPKDNEEELLNRVIAFGYSAVCFCYAFSDFDTRKDKLFSSISKLKKKNPDTKVYTGIFFTEESLKKSANLQKYYDFIFLLATKNLQETLSRTKNLHFIYGLETLHVKDSLHHRKTGINQVISRMLAENEIKVILSFKNLLDSSNPRLPQTLGRFKELIKLSRKFKFKLNLASFASDQYGLRSKHDLIALLIVLGMHPKEAKDALRL